MTTHMRYRVPRACTNIYCSNEHRASMQSNMSNNLHLFFTDLAVDPNSNSDVHVLDIVDTHKHEDAQISI